MHRLAGDQEDMVESTVHSEAFCANLSGRCQHSTPKEQELVTFTGSGDERLVEAIHRQLVNIDRHCIYVAID